MRTLIALLALLALSGLAVSTLTSCGKSTTSTAPIVQTSTNGGDEQLPLVNGQGPPLETPPDSIVARAEKFFRGPIGPTMLTIAGVPGNVIGNAANSWLGVPYVWGGNSRSGVDCSHLVYQVYHQAGIGSYPFLTTSAMKTYGHFICVNWSSDPGDIVLFVNLGHTGIYMGGGWMVDADSYYGRVMWDNLNSSYWQSMRPYPVRYMP